MLNKEIFNTLNFMRMKLNNIEKIEPVFEIIRIKQNNIKNIWIGLVLYIFI